MKITVNRVAPIVCLLLLPSTANADDVDSLFDLTIEELLDVTVSVASSKVESVIDTPAIVSRYNRADMEKMGISTLKEMFNFIPGVVVQDALTGWSAVQIRGIDEAFNQKVLFLLDGVPYHQPSHSIIPMEGVPWESISHVEVIRGPGAVFHGTQASGGVFNVITRKDTDSNSATVKLGKNKLFETSAYYTHSLSDESAIYVSAELRSEDGYDAKYDQVFPDVGVVSDVVRRSLEKKSALVRYTNNDFKVQFHAFTDTTIGINDAYTDLETLQPFVTESESQLLHVENSWNTEKGKTTLFADYNHYTFDLYLNNLFAPGAGAVAKKGSDGNYDYRFRIGGSHTHTVNDSLNLVFGIENETRSIGAYSLYAQAEPGTPLATLIDRGNIDELSAYSQIDYTYNNWRLLLGGRLTDNEKNGKKVTPRIAAVYSIDEHQSIKALYSTGFNSPNPTQTSIFLPGNVIGNDKLNAEIVKATDIAYSYSKSNILFVANIYHLEAEDFIIRRYSPELVSVSFFNEGNYSRRGAELDFQMARKNSNIFANLAYQKDGNKLDNQDLNAFRIPRLTLSLGANVHIDETHSVGGSIAHIGARQNLNSFNVVNVNYTAKFEQFEVSALVKNLFNETILNPNISSLNSTLVAPGEEGVHFQLSARYYF